MGAEADARVTGAAGVAPRSRAVRFWRLWATLVFLTGVIGFNAAWQGPPRDLPADAPIEVFSAGRAMRHVEAMAREPHPLGSIAQEPVRRYVIDELKALGLDAEIQRPRDAAEPGVAVGETATRAHVQNIVARWRGTGPAERKALLLSSHYDSVRFGPGAGDDAAGVAAILEALRALKAGGPPPERDIIVLITDGEEIGLYGADVFAAEHPWANDVGAAINLEGRGNSGVSFMFETSDQNGWLIAQMASALPHPMASSVTYEVYRLMPNDTDLTVYKQYQMAGWNFAYVGGLAAYHSPADNPANLDRRTLQHQGENLLAMARRLVRLDLEDVRREDVVYCSILQWFVAVYPLGWVMPLFEMAAVLYFAVVWLGVAQGRIRASDVAAGFAVMLATLPAGVMAVGLLWTAMRVPLIRADLLIFRPDLGQGAGMFTSPHDVALLTGLAAVAVLVTALVFRWAARLWRWEGLGLGALGWWLVAAGATSLYMPGASYAFVWPLLALLGGQSWAFLRPRGRLSALLAAWLATVPLLVVQIMLIVGIFQGLNVRVAAYLMIPVILVAGALVPAVGQAMVGVVVEPGSSGEPPAGRAQQGDTASPARPIP